MKRNAWILLLLFAVAVVPLQGGEVTAEELAKIMKMGDSAAASWDHKTAFQHYEKVLKHNPDNYEALWKAGDEMTEYADGLSKDMSKVKEYNFSKSAEYCEKAIELNPEGWEAHFYLSVAMGRLALFRGGKEKIRLSQVVKDEADKAIELNPEADLAFHVLGRWHQNLANLGSMLKFFAKILYGGVPPGTNEEAVENFQKAIEIDPEHIEHYLELARTYKFMGQKELMREPLEKVLKLKPVEEDDKSFQKEAESMLKKLK